MMAVRDREAGPLAIPLDALKAYLRIGTAAEDALLAGLIRAATGLCEQFTGQWLIAREGEAVLEPCRDWRPIGTGPVRSIREVVALAADGSESLLPVGGHAIDIDAGGTGWIRVDDEAGATRILVRFEAGLAADWNGVPEPLRQGIVRFAADQYAGRGGEAKEGPDAPSAAVTVLWRPWRRMRLAGAGG